MTSKTALIVGVTGQSGSYLAHHLLSCGFNVVGSTRDIGACNTSRLDRLCITNDVELISLSPSDFRSVLNAVSSYKPTHIFNLAGITSVGLSFSLPFDCFESIATATLNFLEVIRFLDVDIRYFSASSSECFGDTGFQPANEASNFNPLSPYAVAKCSSFWQVSSYRKAYNMFCCSGILSNHESPLRSPHFVTSKIVSSAIQISQGLSDSLRLGNLDIYRDWGWAPDYVKAMHLMLSADSPQDYVIASGSTHSLYDFATAVFAEFGLSFSDYFIIDEAFMRPADLRLSYLDPSLIRNSLGWQAENSFDCIVSKLVSAKLF
ncbi:MAG: GDP-mannose 4,6-dehydratase [Rickettsiales bacterium]|nr:GDP-mannose 4,6-dehydratase [Rickettsiales bacterium]